MSSSSTIDLDNATLPPGWARVFSESRSRYYYVYAEQNHKQWTFPSQSEAADITKAKQRVEEKMKRQTESRLQQDPPNLEHEDGETLADEESNKESRKRRRDDLPGEDGNMEEDNKRRRLSHEDLEEENLQLRLQLRTEQWSHDVTRNVCGVAVSALARVEEENRVLEEEKRVLKETLATTQDALGNARDEYGRLKNEYDDHFRTMVEAQVGCEVRDVIQIQIVEATTKPELRTQMEAATTYREVCTLAFDNSDHVDWNQLGFSKHDARRFNWRFGEFSQNRLNIAHPVKECAENVAFLRTVFDCVCNILCDGNYDNAAPSLKNALNSTFGPVQTRIVNENRTRRT